MTQNDFLRPLLALSPWVMALLVWSWGFGSLLLVAARTHSMASVLLRHPGFILGDFAMLPLAGFLIAFFCQRVVQPVPAVTSAAWSYAAAAVALALAVSSAVRNDMVNVWWVGHLAFYWFIAYLLTCFLAKGVLQLILGEGNRLLWIVWLGVVGAVFIHQILPVLFGPKVLPKP